jgi:2-oxo-4-hydroxy-4-carboxy-5-ureidoimidazoline decarboxylase
VTLAELNALSADVARVELERCCGSERWASIVAARRPFGSADELMQAASDVWWALDEADWLQAFSHHPRIGEPAEGWAAAEQAGTHQARRSTMLSLAALNREYEDMFGYVFLICAARTYDQRSRRRAAHRGGGAGQDHEVAAREAAERFP